MNRPQSEINNPTNTDVLRGRSRANSFAAIAVDVGVLLPAALLISLGSDAALSNGSQNSNPNYVRVGNGRPKTEIRWVASYEAFTAWGLAEDARNVFGTCRYLIDLYLVSDGGRRVEITADDNLLQFIGTDVQGGTLKLTATERMQPTGPVRIVIAAPESGEFDQHVCEVIQFGRPKAAAK